MFSHYEMRTRVMSWDNKWIYAVTRFVTKPKKGKGKEKQTPQTHYPIVLLLSLLDRASILRTPSIVESVVSLLATVTRPLSSLKDKDKKAEATPDTSAAGATAPPAPSAEPPTEAGGDQPSQVNESK